MMEPSSTKVTSTPKSLFSKSLSALEMEAKKMSQSLSHHLKSLLLVFNFFFFSLPATTISSRPVFYTWSARDNLFHNRAGAHPIKRANNITFSYYFTENILSGKEKPRGYRNFKDFFFKLLHG